MLVTDTRRPTTRQLSGLIVVLIGLLGLSATAVEPAPVTIQGHLIGPSGNAVDGAYALQLTLYESMISSEPVYSHNAPAVTVSEGLFSLTFTLPVEVAELHERLWIGVAVDGGEELNRQPLASAPYALVAHSVRDLRVPVSTDAPSDCDETSQGRIYYDATTSALKVCDGSDWQSVGGSSPPVEVPTLSVDFVSWVGEFVSNSPGKGSQGFIVPNAEERTLFRQAVEALTADDLSAAQNLASAIDYELVFVEDTGDDNATLRVLRPKSSANLGRGLFVVRPVSETKRTVIVESPHAHFDSHTGLRAAEIFRALRARAYMVTGTHRCANAAASGCSGSTSVCTGTSQPYRESDQAHTNLGFFQVFHERFADLNHLALQIHGFSSDSNEPEFTFGDGTTTNKSSSEHFVNKLTEVLEDLITTAGSTKGGNSCNRSGDINLLCSTSNTQGRYTNGVSSAASCTTGASGALGGFAHMELSYDLRDPGGLLEPELVIQALLTVLPE